MSKTFPSSFCLGLGLTVLLVRQGPSALAGKLDRAGSEARGTSSSSRSSSQSSSSDSSDASSTWSRSDSDEADPISGAAVIMYGLYYAALAVTSPWWVPKFHSGIGPQHFCDSPGCLHGVDFTWGFEAFPGRPIVFGLEGSIGNLDHVFAPGLRIRLGYLIGPVEASIGWHQRWVGTVPLGGPFAGISGWF